MDLRHFIRQLKTEESIMKITSRPSVTYEVAYFEKKFEKRATILMTPKEYHGFKIISNIVNSKKKIALALGIKESQLYDFFLSKIRNPIPYEVKSNSQKFYELKSLHRLPVVKHYEKDAGPYITSSLVLVRNPETGLQNMSIHRMRVLDDDKLVIRMVEGRHLHRIYSLYKEKNENMPIAIVIGVHPTVEIAAAYQAPHNVDELEIANALLGGRLKVIRTSLTNLNVPIAEFVLEGEVSISEMGEDRMVEMLGNYDMTRMQPIVHVKKIMYRKNAYYRDILPAGREHQLLMSFPIEMKLNKYVKDVVPSTKKVILTSGGCNWLHAVIQISKRLEGDGKNALIAAFAAHPSLKLAIVVDDDIDPENPESVEYALATRFQAGRDLIIIRGAKGSSLDPSSDQVKVLTDKLGMDATIKLEKDKAFYERAKIPLDRK
jgi:UbiD family decarboxylase